jgi:hypothetical protein
MSTDPHRPETSTKRQGSTQKKTSQSETHESDTSPRHLLSFTIDATTAHVVKLESLDSAGGHHALTEAEIASLSKDTRRGTFEEALEQAFEAGIACALGDDSNQPRQRVSAKEAELRHLLLGLLIEDSKARRLMQRDVIGRAVLGTLIDDAMMSHNGDAND